MDYINCKEAATRWAISERRVRAFCSEKKIPGAVFMGKQWMIPATASRPVDGRTKEAKDAGPSDDYIFPVPLFSSDFNHKEVLGEYGERLLNIQWKYLDGNYTQGFILAKELQMESPPEHILVGVYYIQLYFTMLLGLSEEFRWYYNRLETITKKSGPHQEDYKLAFYSMLLHVSWNFEDFMVIDPTKLSPAALPLYKITLSVVSIASMKDQSDISLKQLEANYCESKINCLYPVEMTTAGNLISAYMSLGNTDKAQQYAEIFCELALRLGCTTYIAKWYSHAFSYVNRFFSKHKPSEISNLTSTAKRNIMNIMLIRSAMFSKLNNPFEFGEDTELAILLAYGVNTKAIAEIKGISVEKLDEILKAMCESQGCSNLKELSKKSMDVILGFSAEKKNK